MTPCVFSYLPQAPNDRQLDEHHDEDDIPLWRGFGQGLFEDLKTKLPWYLSDFKDGFHSKSITTVLYLYWGCLANAVSFGSVLDDATEGYIGATETLMAAAVLGMIYPLLCGQPLTIMGPTGPIMVRSIPALFFPSSRSNLY